MVKQKVYVLTVKDYNRSPESPIQLESASFDQDKLYALMREMEKDEEFENSEFNIETVYLI